MYHLLNLLNRTKIVKDIKILNFIEEENINLFYAKVILIDNSFLFVRELLTVKENKYSYH